MTNVEKLKREMIIDSLLSNALTFLNERLLEKLLDLEYRICVLELES